MIYLLIIGVCICSNCHSVLELMYNSILVMVKMAGPWCLEAQNLFKELGQQLRYRGCNHSSGLWLVQRAASIMGTFGLGSAQGGTFLDNGCFTKFFLNVDIYVLI